MKPYNAKSWEVRAFLNGEKTAIVLPIKPQPPLFIDQMGFTAFTPVGHISGRGYWKGVPGEEGYGEKFYKMPYEVGDSIYVRETCELVLPDCEGDPIRVLYSDGAKQDTPKDCHGIIDWVNGRAKRSSATMPKWASRITLTVVEVKAVRLHDLGTSQIGMAGISVDPSHYTFNNWKIEMKSAMKYLWNDRYAKQGLGWDANPWVWLVKVVKA